MSEERFSGTLRLLDGGRVAVTEVVDCDGEKCTDWWADFCLRDWDGRPATVTVKHGRGRSWLLVEVESEG